MWDGRRTRRLSNGILMRSQRLDASVLHELPALATPIDKFATLVPSDKEDDQRKGTHAQSQAGPKFAIVREQPHGKPEHNKDKQ
jgi:hypothetical protein